ncbi:MAG: eCIS core domain-containing protein [Halobacteriota archaeon]
MEKRANNHDRNVKRAVNAAASDSENALPLSPQFISRGDLAQPIAYSVLNESGSPLESAHRIEMKKRFAQDFSQVHVHTDEKAAQSERLMNARVYAVENNIAFATAQYTSQMREGLRSVMYRLTRSIQARDSDDRLGSLRVGMVYDEFEEEADRVAEHVMHTLEPGLQNQLDAENKNLMQTKLSVQRRISNAVDGAGTSPVVPEVFNSPGQPLDTSTRAFMESRFGVDFGFVRTHSDGKAIQACRHLNAEAFTFHHDIYFGAGRSPGNDKLTAHELTHVIQQTSRQPAGIVTKSAKEANLGHQPNIQRKLALRPPGRGEVSAFGRAQELIDRLNTLSPAIQYRLAGQDLVYEVKNPTALTHFDTVMKGFIDRAELVPMRLITRKGYVGGGPLMADSFVSGYVDLDDLLADDVYSFQSDLLQFLTERFQVRDYARRIGTHLHPLFPKAHLAGKDAEAVQLQYLFRDPSIRFYYEETRPNDTWVNAFKSRDLGYWVFQVVHRSGREVAGGEMWIKKRDGTRATIEDFRKERAAAPR